MAKKALIALTALAAVLAIVQSAQARANLEITAPENGREYTTLGEVEIVISVKNDGPDNAENVQLLIEVGGGIKYSADKIAALGAGQTRNIHLRVTGQVDERIEVGITAYGSGTEGVNDDHLSIVLLPPKAELRIESPAGDLSLVGVPENGTAKISVTVKNWGDATLFGVALTIERTSAGLSCETSGPQDIDSRKTAAYSVTCDNVSYGKSLRIRAADAKKKAFDTLSITLRLVEQMLPKKLEIISPLENAELRIPETGGLITLLVRNNGLASLTGVCAFAEGIPYNSSNCTDLAYNKTAAFNITLAPAQELTLADLIVNDSRGKAQDEIGVRVLRVQVIQQADNQTINGTNGTAEETNGTQNAGDQGSGDQDVNVPNNQNGGPPGIPQDIFNILLIVVPLAILGIYVKMAVSKANRD